MSMGVQTFTRTGKIVASIVAAVLIILIAYVFADIIFLLIISIFIAFIYNPIVQFFENKGANRITAVLLVFFISAITVIFILAVFIPKIAIQANTIAQSFSHEKLSILIDQLSAELKVYLPFLNYAEFSTKIENFLSSIFLDSVDNLSRIVSSLVSILAIAVIIPFMTFFILKDHRKIVKGIVNIAPNKYFEFTFHVIHKISLQLGKFVRGWIFDAVIVGLMAGIGLAILGIQNAFTIGFIAGIGHLVPYFGPLIGGLPAIAISLIQFGDFSMLPEISIMFIIVYTLDNGYIQPNIFAKATDIHPLMIILIILIGSQVLGIAGMLLAIPTATVLKTAATEIYLGFKNYKIIHG
ncbi:MAG: AI-2E family transporter [Bacteroidetes bacterium]|nr:AI-2E family transporter [Bacteroidota bacterium]